MLPCTAAVSMDIFWDNIRPTHNWTAPLSMSFGIFAFFVACLGVVGYVMYRLGRAHGHAQVELRLSQAQTDAARIESDLQARLESTRGQLVQAHEALAQLQSRSSQQEGLIARQQAELTQARQDLQTRAEEQKVVLDKHRADFENLAMRIFQASTQSLGTQNKENLDSLLTPLKEQIGDFRKSLEQANTDQAQRVGGLSQQVESLLRSSGELGKQALELTQALRGNSQVRGAWGELLLQNILEASGLRSGAEYEMQVSMRSDEDGLYRPDAVVHLPGQRDVIVDSKVLLEAWARYVSAADEPTRAAALKAHIAAIRAQIDSLASKDYSHLPGLHSLDAVLLFVAHETALTKALEQEPALMTDALRKKVILVGPSNLWVVLKTVEYTWTSERRDQNALKIADKAGALLDKLALVLESLGEVDDRIKKLQEAQFTVRDRLASGRGNVLKTARELIDLGARTRRKDMRQLTNALDDAGGEDAEDESDVR